MASQIISADSSIASPKSQVDFTCKADSDCTVKNIGNCCGYFPACVNKNSETFPQRVASDCEKSGTASVCGYTEITACACVNQVCSASSSGDPR